VELKVNRNLCRERFEVFRRRQVGDECVRVFYVDFLFHKTRAEIKIKAPFEMLFDEILV
jgi:hypothetical protein